MRTRSLRWPVICAALVLSACGSEQFQLMNRSTDAFEATGSCARDVLIEGLQINQRTKLIVVSEEDFMNVASLWSSEPIATSLIAILAGADGVIIQRQEPSAIPSGDQRTALLFSEADLIASANNMLNRLYIESNLSSPLGSLFSAYYEEERKRSYEPSAYSLLSIDRLNIGEDYVHRVIKLALDATADYLVRPRALEWRFDKPAYELWSRRNLYGYFVDLDFVDGHLSGFDRRIDRKKTFAVRADIRNEAFDRNVDLVVEADRAALDKRFQEQIRIMETKEAFVGHSQAVPTAIKIGLLHRRYVSADSRGCGIDWTKAAAFPEIQDKLAAWLRVTVEDVGPLMNDSPLAFSAVNGPLSSTVWRQLSFYRESVRAADYLREAVIKIREVPGIGIRATFIPHAGSVSRIFDQVETNDLASRRGTDLRPSDLKGR